MIGLGLGLVRQAVRNASGQAWTPAQLFSDGQQGVWYEPKPEYLYQDAAGTVPVTADGDPVGLMLDLSKGLELGPEEAPSLSIVLGSGNVTFSHNGSTSFSASSDGTGDSSVRPKADFPASLAGNWVSVTVTFSNLSGNTRFGIYDGNNYVFGAEGVEEETKDFIFRASPGGFIAFDGRNAFSADMSFSIRELPGNHATQETSAARPIYRTDGVLHWLEFDGVDDGLQTDKIQYGQDWLAIAGAVYAGNKMSVLDSDPFPPRQAQILRSGASDGYARSIAFNETEESFSSGGSVDRRGERFVMTASVQGGECLLRENGNQGSTVQITGAPAATNCPLAIGCRIGGSQYLDGRVYGAVLVADAYTAPSDTEKYIANLTGVTL